jgi:putative peptide maturation dehydrogenase
MSDTRRVRRCAALLMRPCDRRALDFAALLGGREAVVVEHGWEVLAPHLDRIIDLDATDAIALGRIAEIEWTPAAALVAEIGAATLKTLIDAGLVLVEGGDETPREREHRLHEPPWHPLAAAAHMFSRWTAVDSLAAQESSRIHSTADLIDEFGPPPPHFHTRADATERLALGTAAVNALDGLMARRVTCRNFDTALSVSQADLGALLRRTFGVHGSEEVAAGAVALKKNHPSGGGLHPLEAYLIVQRVDGVAPGLHHYSAEAHALDRLSTLSTDAARVFAMVAVAGQDYFADAPVLLIVSARFARALWKYRRHPKIQRAITLEAGHVSQNLYLAATDLGLGAFVTAAINEIDIERALGFDPLQESALAVCGFGPRTRRKTTVELDPCSIVWDADRLR